MRYLYQLADSLAELTVVASYCSPGIKIRRKLFSDSDMDVDMTDRVVIVTGANSGLGRATCQELGRRNATVVLACRNPESGERAAAELREEFPKATFHLELVDLADRTSLRQFISRIQSTYKALDVLVNNAGVLLPKRSETADGIETTFATNVLSGFILTEHLMPLLAASGSGRVINVTSGGMYTQRYQVDDPEFRDGSFDGVRAYAQTKRAQVILTELWAEKIRATETSVTVNCMHPGWAATPGVRKSLPGFYNALQSILRTPEEGADTIAWLAISSAAPAFNGQLLFDRAVRRTHVFPRTRISNTARARLWNYCAERSD